MLCADFLAPKPKPEPKLKMCRVDFLSGQNENKFNLSVSYAFHEVANSQSRTSQRPHGGGLFPLLFLLLLLCCFFFFHSSSPGFLFSTLCVVIVALVANLVGYHCGGQNDTQHHYLPHSDSRHFRPVHVRMPPASSALAQISSAYGRVVLVAPLSFKCYLKQLELNG